MSAQMVEILILAIVAFLIISKLLSILGTTDEDDPAHKTGFFGEPTGLKDVTGTVETVHKNSKNQPNIIPLRKNIIYSTDPRINEIIYQIVSKIPNFDHEKFLRGAKSAVKMIITALNDKDDKSLVELVDKRFIVSLREKEYNIDITDDNIDTQFEDAYSFGNSIYIKLLITAANTKECWVFTRNINQAGPAWYLSNIEAYNPKH